MACRLFLPGHHARLPEKAAHIIRSFILGADPPSIPSNRSIARLSPVGCSGKVVSDVRTRRPRPSPTPGADPWRLICTSCPASRDPAVAATRWGTSSARHPTMFTKSFVLNLANLMQRFARPRIRRRRASKVAIRHGKCLSVVFLPAGPVGGGWGLWQPVRVPLCLAVPVPGGPGTGSLLMRGCEQMHGSRLVGNLGFRSDMDVGWRDDLLGLSLDALQNDSVSKHGKATVVRSQVSVRACRIAGPSTPTSANAARQPQSEAGSAVPSVPPDASRSGCPTTSVNLVAATFEYARPLVPLSRAGLANR